MENCQTKSKQDSHNNNEKMYFKYDKNQIYSTNQIYAIYYIIIRDYKQNSKYVSRINYKYDNQCIYFTNKLDEHDNIIIPLSKTKTQEYRNKEFTINWSNNDDHFFRYFVLNLCVLIKGTTCLNLLISYDNKTYTTIDIDDVTNTGFHFFLSMRLTNPLTQYYIENKEEEYHLDNQSTEECENFIKQITFDMIKENGNNYNDDIISNNNNINKNKNKNKYKKQKKNKNKNKNKEKNEIKDNTCVICMENKREYLIQPCGHFCYCHICIEKIKICSICNQVKLSHLKVFNI